MKASGGEGAPAARERRVEAILGGMSLAEKVGQLNHPSAGTGVADGEGNLSAGFVERLRRGEVGWLGTGRDLGQLRELQRIAHEESAHGIPIGFTLDVIHGHRTIFPLPLALACAWDETLVRDCARVAAVEAGAAGVALSWAPMLDVSRDARWGRCAESPGEDPLLGERFARATVEGFGNGDLSRPDSLMACAKHFAGYGFAEAGRDYHEVDISPYRMHDSVLPPFRAALDAGVGAVMVGFHALAGVPCSAHRELLQGLLRGRWGFDGLVVSDHSAIIELVAHGVAADARAAARLAFEAGIDVDLASEVYVKHLPALVADGEIEEAAIDRACRRVLRAKLALGLFGDPWRRLDAARRDAVTGAPAHRALARAAAVRSSVLLKNDGTLPLAGDARIALIGPLADDRANLQGTWAVRARAAESVSVLEALAAAGRRVTHARGADIVDDPDIAARLNVFGPTATIDPRGARALLDEALAVVAAAEVVVACVGEAKEHSGESATRTALDLPGRQRALLETVHASGKPLVLVTMSGRPLALEWEAAHANAMVHTWFGGSETGSAVADLLYGVAEPGGRLAMSFPRTVGQCPLHYAEPPTGRPPRGPLFEKFTTANRLEGAHTALYPFGHGLGYTRFEHGPPVPARRRLRGRDAALHVDVEVRNVGDRDGEEVVQLYAGDPLASLSRPVRRLVAFRRVALAAGATARVRFTLRASDLSFSRAERLAEPEAIWEPGTFVLSAGPSSANLRSASVEWRDDGA